MECALFKVVITEVVKVCTTQSHYPGGSLQTADCQLTAAADKNLKMFSHDFFAVPAKILNTSHWFQSCYRFLPRIETAFYYRTYLLSLAIEGSSLL